MTALQVATSCCGHYVGWMLLARIDGWIGRTLFIPPIVRFCQFTRQSQFAVSRMFWFVAALDGFYRAETLIWSIIWGALSIFMMVTATRRPDTPTGSFMFFRMLAVALLSFDLVNGASTGEWAGAEFWVFVLIAEYAATIRTIPPQQTEKSAAKVRAAK